MELDTGLIYAYASEFLKEDLGRGDVTTQAVVRSGAKARGSFLAKQDLILCGLEFGEAVFAVLDGGIQLESRAHDGEVLKAGAQFARLEASASVLLAGERTALNLIQRMSAIATLTRSFVDRIAGTKAQIIDTRKTTPGLRLIEKYAVTVGGGRNNRSGLDDGVLIKDNHVAMAGGIRRAVELARVNASHLMRIEVEVSTPAGAQEAVKAGADIVMLDNMKVADLNESVRLIRGLSSSTLIEASGRVTVDNVREIAETGVDLISVGAITHSATAVDISMKITPL